MKKFFLILMLSIGFLSACQTPVQEAPEPAEEPETMMDDQVMMDDDLAMADEGMYVNQSLGFSVKIPESWSAFDYVVTEHENSVSFTAEFAGWPDTFRMVTLGRKAKAEWYDLEKKRLEIEQNPPEDLGMIASMDYYVGTKITEDDQYVYYYDDFNHDAPLDYPGGVSEMVASFMLLN